MAAEKVLTDADCKRAKPESKVYYLNDGAGLRLRIRPNGNKAWIYRFKIGSKESSTSLGGYPQVGLSSARTKLSASKGHVILGTSPTTAKRIAKATQIVKSAATFSLVAKEWVDHNKADWSPSHLERNEGLIRRYLNPKLGLLPVDAIKEPFLFKVIKETYDSGIKESARRALRVAAQVFSYAKFTHQGKGNPARDMSENNYFKKPTVKHFAAIPQTDVRALVDKLNLTGVNQTLDLKTVCALKMAMYTGLRDNSIRGALWKEIDFNTSIWTVPGSRMKCKREHQVPLPNQAINSLLSIKAHTYRNSNSFIFPGGGKTKIMSEGTLRLALHRLGFKVTVHGMRSLITNVLNENGFNRDAVERQLDHQEQNKVRASYLTSDFMPLRIQMMQWFADWCDGKISNSISKNVHDIKSVA